MPTCTILYNYMYIIEKWEKTVIGLEMQPAITSMSYSPVVEKCTTNFSASITSQVWKNQVHDDCEG